MGEFLCVNLPTGDTYVAIIYVDLIYIDGSVMVRDFVGTPTFHPTVS